MGVYELGADEVVIMRDSHVFEGRVGITLILTSRNLIQINKNFWGADKSAEKYPLLDLKAQNGKPNILNGKAQNGSSRLELYFLGYERYYTFQSMFAERKWAGAIEKAYKSCVAEQNKSDAGRMGIGALLSPLKTTIDSAKRAVAPKTKTVKCPRCGADLGGEKGQDVKCDYCNAVIKIS